MPALPIGNFVNPNLPVKKIFTGPRQLIFLISCVLVFLVIVFFIVDYQFAPKVPKVKKTYPAPTLNLDSIVYPSSVWKTSVNNSLKAAKEEKDLDKRFVLYEGTFTTLLSVYLEDHSLPTREQLEALSAFIKSDFPTKYKAENFKIPCLDTNCAKADYPGDIKSIKDKVEQSEMIHPLVKGSIQNSFEAAALSTDVEVQWTYYLKAFNTLVSEKRRLNDDSVGAIAGDLRDFLKSKYSEKYKEFEEILPKALEI